MTKEKLKELRHRARTDLFWLAKEILGYDALIERVHRPVCEHFVHKNPAKPFEDQDKIKERLLLDPRGHFKTTLDIADIVQWIINFPDIRILIMTGKRDLAELMLREVKSHFQNNEKMRALFPEFCVSPGLDFGNTSEIIIPNRRKKHLKEPTVTISSGESVKAGYHFDVIKCDDLVHEENIGTAEQLQKTIDRWNYTTPLLEPYGYRDTIGTPYDYSDLYGFLQENRPDIKVFKRSVGKLLKDGNNWRIVDLLFPERFTEQWLLNQRKTNPYIFNCQYMCDPTPVDAKTFTEELILRHTIPHQQVPRSGRLFITWDLGFSQKEYADWSVGAVGLFDEIGRLFILDVVFGRFGPHELLRQILALNLKWRPAMIGIEKAAGSELLAPSIDLIARQQRIRVPIEWIPVKATKGAKEERIGSLHPLLEEDKLYFSTLIPKEAMGELLKQFTRFPRFKHDDIPDAISMLLHYRSYADIALPPEMIDMSSTQVYSEGLGAGLVG